MHVSENRRNFDKSSTFAYMHINRVGPKIEHWGTPIATDLRHEHIPFDTTNCFLFLNNETCKLREMPDLFSFVTGS